jgi:hypothetical protein
MGESSRIQARFVVGLAVLACAACTSKVETPDGGGFEPEQPETPPCDPTLPKFTVGGSGIGLTTPDMTGALKVRIDSADHQPPAKAYNTWKIAIEDASGQPMSGATLNWACAWMEVHGHGSNPQAINDLGNGEFELVNQNLSMYGPWAVKLWVDPTGAGPEYLPQNGAKVMAGNNCMPSNGAVPAANVVINFCVPESGS